MVVTDAHSIDFGKIVEQTGRRRESNWSDHAIRTHTLAPHWIKQYAHASLCTPYFLGLYQETRMTNPRCFQAIFIYTKIWLAYCDKPNAISRNGHEVLGRVEACFQYFVHCSARVGWPRISKRGRRVSDVMGWRILIRIWPSCRQCSHGGRHTSRGGPERCVNSMKNRITKGSNDDVYDGVYGRWASKKSARRDC